MTLRWKMGIQIAAMIAGLLLVGLTALWGLDALHADYGVAVAGYGQLRDVYEVGSHLATARALLSLDRPDRAAAAAEVDRSLQRLDLLLGDGDPRPASAPLDRGALAAARPALAAASRQLSIPIDADASLQFSNDAAAVNAAMGAIGSLASRLRQIIEAKEQSATQQRKLTAHRVGAVSLVITLAAIAIGFTQYRAVMRPLGALRSGVRRIAAGQFAQRLTLVGVREFNELAADFNGMAGELDGFYHQLESKVAQKSKELIRSERLASVGYLAAGVAHEINNPLGIISGYAEFSLEQLKRQPATAAQSQAREQEIAKSLSVICEEAFRCKEITEKLLSLARQGDESRQPICLADSADRVATLVGGLREYRDRKLIVEAPASSEARAQLTVLAVEAEMRQVILNLTINALQASPAGGEVRIAVCREGSQVELVVIDHGRGMTPQTLERVFEPFFTEKRGSAESRGERSHGTGLGLSITHAIIESHGGSISVHSDGAGAGSRFTVKLPAIDGDNRIGDPLLARAETTAAKGAIHG